VPVVAVAAPVPLSVTVTPAMPAPFVSRTVPLRL
jgi:hypothetical protein